MKGKVQDCVDLSYPNLHYLSHLIAFDTEARHLADIASVKARAALPGSVPFILLNYVEFLESASSIKVMDANRKKPWFPLSDDDSLYQEWRQILAVPKEQLPRLLVAIPRGAYNDGAQMMTAAIALTNGGTGQNPTIGIRWLHCQ
ncbi:hypothetical protein FIBSPDRAFT_1043970 [Athelia psychrophila]|uniref:Uncharacterized protein n=1 Tax=Athelia psychrophila TaxID=1759441 RepID=A0A166K995_9AGAM|nr:hypothetical protein FIBSPDRAFT_1043970 [Fibularhizoctonia sp. CBS 109695]